MELFLTEIGSEKKHIKKKLIKKEKKSFNTIQTSAERSSIEDLSARRVGTTEALNSLLAGSTISRTNSRARAHTGTCTELKEDQRLI